jgi:two-component system NtrC family sensor kinase
MLILHVLSGPDAGRRFPLPAGEPQLIGRSSEALPITDPSVSRRHAELTPDGDRWRIRDLESHNGTFVNGRIALDAVEIAPGDVIVCGDTRLVVSREADRPAPVAARIEPVHSAVEGRLGPAAAAAADPTVRLLQELAALAGRGGDRAAIIRDAAELVRRELDADRATIELTAPALAAVARGRDGDATACSLPEAIRRETLADGRGAVVVSEGSAALSGLAASIESHGRRHGLVWIEAAIGRRAFDERHLRLLQAMSSHLATVLEAAEAAERATARERLAAMGETVANLSHSVKNMLQALRGGADAVELALGRGDLATARAAWPIVGRNLDRIQLLAQNMLLFAKDRPLEPEPVSPNELVREVATLLAGSAARRSIRIELALDDGVPPVELDANAVHQALLNLLANALEASPDRGSVTVGTRWEAAARAVEVTVTDRGGGFPAAIRARAFEPFVSTKGQRGTGLGLAVSRAIADAHGGRLEIAESGPHGTAMRLTLPDRGIPDDRDRTRAPRSVGEPDLGIEFTPGE